MSHLRLYLKFYQINLKSIAQHRGSFIMFTLSKAIYYVAEFIMLWIMIKTFVSMGSWSAYEIMLLYALSNSSYAIAGSFLYSVCSSISKNVRDGSFDEVLTKPLNPFIYWISTKLSTGYFGTFGVSLFIIILCLYKLEIAMNLYKIIFLFFTILSGGVIMGAIMLLTAAPAFWIVKSEAVMSLFFGSISNFINYPITIFNRVIQVVLTLVLPYAFINFFPAQFLLGKNDFSIFAPVFQFLSPVVAVILFTLAYRFWNYSINHYESTGS